MFILRQTCREQGFELPEEAHRSCKEYLRTQCVQEPADGLKYLASRMTASSSSATEEPALICRVTQHMDQTAHHFSKRPSLHSTDINEIAARFQ
uniref:Uncharacterized protein n=1 Tax=Rhipicephalus zambeziensis TaxID=60191 RepID=A0A224Y6D5_9ACAR